MIDSHAHLIWESFEPDIEEVIERAHSAGISAFIHPCVHTRDLLKMEALQKRFPNIFLSAGVHPCDAQEWTDECFDHIEQYKDKLVAIGETGLDFYHKDCAVEIQEEVFRRQCRIAKELNLPLIVHCRDAFEDTLRVLREESVGKGVMHCYTGNAEYSAKFWELGFYTSFSGCVTFKSAGQLRIDAAKIPIERILLETDCPFLAPQKNRGKRNEPSFMLEVCEVIAQVKELSFDKVNEITVANTSKLFGLNV
jgi:TatD DNase family protein